MQIVLVPNTNSIPIFQGTGTPEDLKEEFEKANCKDLQMSVVKRDLPDVCKKYTFSISATMQEKALGNLSEF